MFKRWTYFFNLAIILYIYFIQELHYLPFDTTKNNLRGFFSQGHFLLVFVSRVVIYLHSDTFKNSHHNFLCLLVLLHSW